MMHMQNQGTDFVRSALGRGLLGLALAAGLALPGSAQAGGYIISEYDSEIAGRGGAGAALAVSPSAVIYNPANLAKLEGLQLRAGVSFIMPRWRFEPQDPDASSARSINEVSYPPNMSLSYNFGNFGFGDLAAGVGIYVPYGSSFSWPDNWVGREEVQEISLRVFEITPAIAYRPSEMFSVGVGLRVLPGDVYLRRAVRFGSAQEGTVELSGTGTEVGVSAGVTIDGFENLSFALTWRSNVIFHARGQSNFDFPPPFDTEAVDRPVRTRLKLPQVFRIGAFYDAIPGTLNFSADLQFQQWSEFTQLRIVFENPDGTEEAIVSRRDAKDSITFSIGGEYIIFEGLAVRAGYAYDERTLPEETVNPAPPDSDRHVLSLGASYEWDGWLGAHVNFASVWFTPRETNLAPLRGTYTGGHGADVTAFIAGITLSAKFDLAPLGTAAKPQQQEDGTIQVPEGQ